LSNAVLGIAVGGTHWISIILQNGWENNTCLCNGGPRGFGTGGELKTNYIMVLMAMMVKQEACFIHAREEDGAEV
jgi:hypothetical protein